MKSGWKLRPVAKSLLVGVICAVDCSLGCRTTPAPIHSEPCPFLSEGNIQYERPLTKHILQVVKYDRKDAAGGIEKIYVTLRNLSKSALWVDIRTTFLDSDCHVLEKTNWEPTRLDARTVSEYTCTPIGDASSEFQVLIRLPKKQVFGEQ